VAALDAQRAGASGSNAAVGGSSGSSADVGGLLARALFVQELTKRDPAWAEWRPDSEHVSPEVRCLTRAFDRRV
jgi:hypothetical protein